MTSWCLGERPARRPISTVTSRVGLLSRFGSGPVSACGGGRVQRRGERSVALTYLVGQSRAFLQQLDHCREELGGLADGELAPLLDAVARAEAAVRVAERLGTERLRGSR